MSAVRIPSPAILLSTIAGLSLPTFSLYLFLPFNKRRQTLLPPSLRLSLLLYSLCGDGDVGDGGGDPDGDLKRIDP